ncbi:MAG TPA: hypothetical protein VHW01_16810 [Polyangiaceae bacterium]|jgi:hypothetical protein|nr:hypothetical protein [Polyangiaceae bacterium]
MAAKKKMGATPKPKAAKTPKAASAGAKPAFGSPAWRAKYMKSGGK